VLAAWVGSDKDIAEREADHVVLGHDGDLAVSEASPEAVHRAGEAHRSLLGDEPGDPEGILTVSAESVVTAVNGGRSWSGVAVAR
jgi:hypothetical protein